MTQDSPPTRNIGSLIQGLKEIFLSLSIREQQLVLLSLLLGSILLIFVGLTVCFSSSREAGEGSVDSSLPGQGDGVSKSSTVKVADIATPSQGVGVVDTWVKNMQISYEKLNRENESVKSQNKILEERVDVIDTLFRAGLKNGGQLNFPEGAKTTIERGDMQQENQGRSMGILSDGEGDAASSMKQPAHQQSGQIFPPVNSQGSPNGQVPFQGIQPSPQASNRSSSGYPEEESGRHRSRNLIYHAGSGNYSRSSLKRADTYLPAGSHAKVALLSGVVAMTSVESQGNPLPIVLRVIDDGNLPRGFKSRIKNAQMIGACYGDLSSERVYCRLETMSWVEADGTTVEKKVEGWILGEDGRPGLRGEVVDKSGDVTRQAMLSGVLSSMASFFQMEATKSVYPISPLGVTNALSMGDALKGAAAGGVGNALDKLTEFIIKRAEQMQPVIVIAAGRVGDVVFKTGVNVTPYEETEMHMVSASEGNGQGNLN